MLWNTLCDRFFSSVSVSLEFVVNARIAQNIRLAREPVVVSSIEYHCRWFCGTNTDHCHIYTDGGDAKRPAMSKCVRMYIGQRLLILFFKFIHVIYCPPLIYWWSHVSADAWWLRRARCVRNHYHFTDSSILPNFQILGEGDDCTVVRGGGDAMNKVCMFKMCISVVAAVSAVVNFQYTYAVRYTVV